MKDEDDPEPENPAVPGAVGGASQTDTDGDGTPDNQDPDIDGDGIPNSEDDDDDNDGIPDDRDIGPMTGYDIEKLKQAIRTGKEKARTDSENKLEGLAPSWEALYQRALVESQNVPIVAFGRGLDFSIPDASCPVFSGHIGYLNTDLVIDVHCEVWPILSSIISPIMLFFYSYKAFRLFIR